MERTRTALVRFIVVKRWHEISSISLVEIAFRMNLFRQLSLISRFWLKIIAAK